MVYSLLYCSKSTATIKQVCAGRCPSAVNVTLLAFAAERGSLQQLSIDAARARDHAANPPHAAAALCRRD